MEYASVTEYRTPDGRAVRITVITAACVAVEVEGQPPRQYRVPEMARAYVVNDLRAVPYCPACGRTTTALVDPLRTGRHTCLSCAAQLIDALAEDARADEETRRRPAELQRGQYGKQRIALHR